MVCEVFVTQREFENYQESVETRFLFLQQVIQEQSQRIDRLEIQLDSHVEETLCGNAHGGITDVGVTVDANNERLQVAIQVCKVVSSDETPIGFLKGRDGKDGKDGADGKDGIDGVDGIDGLPGTNGRDGIDGIDGRNGIDGRDGIDGINGRDGIDGEDGEDGRDGIDGVDGRDGRNGRNGRDGNDGIDGRDGTDGNKGERGESGKDGRDGNDGRDGKDGNDNSRIVGVQLEYQNDLLRVTLTTDAGNSIRSNTVEIAVSREILEQILECCQDNNEILNLSPFVAEELECVESPNTDNGLAIQASGTNHAVIDLGSGLQAIVDMLNNIHNEICNIAPGLIPISDIPPYYTCTELLDDNGNGTGEYELVRVDDNDNAYLNAIAPIDNLKGLSVPIAKWLETQAKAYYNLSELSIGNGLLETCSSSFGGDNTILTIENRDYLAKGSELHILFCREQEVRLKSPKNLRPVYIPNPISGELLQDWDTYFLPIKKIVGRTYTYVRFTNTSTQTAHYGNVEGIIDGEYIAPEVDNYYDSLALLTNEVITKRNIVATKNPRNIKFNGDTFVVWSAKRYDIVDGQKTNVQTFKNPLVGT